MNYVCKFLLAFPQKVVTNTVNTGMSIIANRMTAVVETIAFH